jgi:hypothetical protein
MSFPTFLQMYFRRVPSSCFARFRARSPLVAIAAAAISLPVVPLVSAQTAAPGLGQASGYAVLTLTGTRMDLNNVTINGNAGAGPNGSVNLAAPTTINGTLYTDPSIPAGSITKAGNATGGIKSKSLSGAVADALSASSTFAGLTPSQTLSSITSATTINRTGPVTVIKVNGDINLNNQNLTLNGGSTDSFVLNIQGTLTLVGSASLNLTGGLLAQNVFYNFIGSSGTITSHVGDTVNGVVLAPTYDLNLDGVYNGAVIIGGTTASFMSASTVNGTTPAAAGTGTTVSIALTSALQSNPVLSTTAGSTPVAEVSRDRTGQAPTVT